MNFYSMRDLRTSSGKLWSDLKAGNDVVLTVNGKPSALVIDIPEGGFDETVEAVRQARAVRALADMRKRAAARGYMSDDDINRSIEEARK